MYLDITRSLDEGLALYPGDPPPCRWRYRARPADGYEASVLVLGSHTGTHVDAPRHFLEGGLDVAALPIDVLCGPAQVVDVRDSARLTLDSVQSLPLDRVARLLLRTPPNFTLEPDAARHLARSTGVRLLGVEALSIEADAPGFPAHLALLGSTPPVLIVEGLDLEAAAPGGYDLICLPLKWQGADGCPVRAVLRRSVATP